MRKYKETKTRYVLKEDVKNIAEKYLKEFENNPNAYDKYDEFIEDILLVDYETYTLEENEKEIEALNNGYIKEDNISDYAYDGIYQLYGNRFYEIYKNSSEEYSFEITKIETYTYKTKAKNADMAKEFVEDIIAKGDLCNLFYTGSEYKIKSIEN